MTEKRELNALINLLDDPDEMVFSHIREKILSLGTDVIPELETAWEHSFTPLLQKRLENIIHQLQYETVKANLKKWKEDGAANLFDGACLVARYQYPDLDTEKLREQLLKLKHEVWLELNENLTALEKVKVINHILFDVHGFGGNTTNFHAPQNSFINNVLESKKGNPLSLSIIYSLVAQWNDIPIFGVNLPEHFILAYQDTHLPLHTDNTDFGRDILFYINPFSKGTVFGKKEIDTFLNQLQLTPKAAYYEPCSNLDMIKRVLRNLIAAFEKQGYAEKTAEIRELMEILN